MKVKITDVCLVAIDCYKYAQAIASLRNCMDKCEFDRVVFLTDIDIEEEGIEIVKIPRISSKEGYSAFVLKQLWKHFDQKHCLIVQWDGSIINGEVWDDGFKEFDLVGAKWLYPDSEYNCGNGGFTLRSRKLMKITGSDDNIDILHPCDEVLGRLYRKYLEKNYDIKFAPIDVCDKFSFELNAPTQKTFGSHGFFHQPFKPHIVLKRQASCGDIVMLCPVIEYYCEKGYQVVLDTMPQFMQLFHRYKYPIKHISEMDSRIVPEKMISFDMGYELTPTIPAIKAYINLTGEDIKPQNAKLYFEVDPSAHFFQRVILIHTDNTSMNYRNENGVNWQMVVAYYQKLGYLVFQIGKRMDKKIAPHMNTTSYETLMFALKGCDLFIGIDSGPLQIAVALDVPAIGMFGSVNPSLRYYPSEKLITLHTDCPSGKDRYCYHESRGKEVGNECEHNKEIPPCTFMNEWAIIQAANKLLKLN